MPDLLLPPVAPQAPPLPSEAITRVDDAAVHDAALECCAARAKRRRSVSFSDVVEVRFYEAAPDAGARPLPPRLPKSMVVEHRTGQFRPRVVQFSRAAAMIRHSRATRGLMRQSTQEAHNTANLEMAEQACRSVRGD